MPCLLAYVCKLPARFSFFETSWAPDPSASGQQFLWMAVGIVLLLAFAAKAFARVRRSLV